MKAAPERKIRHLAEQVEPQPWQSAEDANSWRRLARTPGSGGPPLISVQVDRDAEQSQWLREEATRAGIGYAQLLRDLIDRVRASTREAATEGSPANDWPGHRAH